MVCAFRHVGVGRLHRRGGDRTAGGGRGNPFRCRIVRNVGSGGFALAAERADTRTGYGTEVPPLRSTASNMTVTVIDGIPPRIRTARSQTRGHKRSGTIRIMG